MNRVAFLDLNGTLVSPVLVEFLEDLRIIPGVPEAVALLTGHGFRCPVVTVQSRIEKGMFSLAQFLSWFDGFAAQLALQGARVEGPYVCPHRYATPCACKKPSTLLYERAAREAGSELSGAFVIGDTEDDMEAARRFGGIGCLVGPTPAAGQGAPLTSSTPPFRGLSLAEAVTWILASSAA